MTTKTAVRKWGNSLGLRLGKSIVDALDWSEGTALSVTVSGNKLVIQEGLPEYELDELVRGITKANMPAKDAWLTAKPVGNELW